MATIGINFSITSNAGCGSITFADTSNYGSNYGEITGTLITFNLSNGTEVSFDNFIPTAENQGLTIYASDFNYQDIIPDQIVTITYTVYGASGSILGTKTASWLLSCNFVNCFFAQVVKAANTPGCNKSDLQRLNELYMRFIGIQTSVEQNAGCNQWSIEELNFECAKFCFNGCR